MQQSIIFLKLPSIKLDDPPTLAETQSVKRLLSKGKAPGSDSIPAEIYKQTGPALTESFTGSFYSRERRKRFHRISGMRQSFTWTSARATTRYAYFENEHETTNLVFAARQLQEKCQEQNTDLYSTFVDLTYLSRQSAGKDCKKSWKKVGLPWIVNQDCTAIPRWHASKSSRQRWDIRALSCHQWCQMHDVYADVFSHADC